MVHKYVALKYIGGCTYWYVMFYNLYEKILQPVDQM